MFLGQDSGILGVGAPEIVSQVLDFFCECCGCAMIIVFI